MPLAFVANLNHEHRHGRRHAAADEKGKEVEFRSTFCESQ